MDAQRKQMVRQPISAAVQFTVAEELFFEHHGNGVRGAFCLLFEQLVDKSLLREAPFSGIKIHQQLLAL